MKKVFTIFAAVLLTATLWAQSPEKMSYQAVIRDNNNQLITNRKIGMQISILQGSVFGTYVYVETQTPETNKQGLISIEIGEGTVVSGEFSLINWANGPYFIKTETDPTGGTSYTISGTSQLLSVPYALYAKTAENITGNITETDPVFKGSQAANITTTDITNLGNLSGTNTGDQDLSSLATKAALSDSITLMRGEIPDVSGYILAEADPVYTASQAANITTTDITNLGNLSGTNTGDQDLSDLATTAALSDSIALMRGEIPDVSGYILTEADPVYTASQAANITASDIDNLGNLSGTNTGDQDLSGIATNQQAIQDTAIQIRADIPDVSGFLSSETDPVFTSSEAINISSTDITSLRNLSGINTGDQDGSETKVIAGTNVTVTGIGTTASPYVVGTTTLTIGQSYQGGIIFWLDATGQHGLIAATTDQSTGIQWYNGTNRYTGATGYGLYAGVMNTTMIVATQISDNQTGNFAAKVCADYKVTVDGITYGDWYLPSINELNLLYVQKDAVGGFANGLYWSSNEYANNYVWVLNFSNGNQPGYSKGTPACVRAIRSF